MIPPTPFSATEWLSSFRAVGGYCWFPRPKDMHVGWQIDGHSFEEHDEARRLYDTVERSDQREERWLEIEALVFAEVKAKIDRALEGVTVH